jgi:MFS family permease
MTASTKRMSLGSLSSSKRPIRYGTGRYATTELVPQPSDDPDDPLRWPRWKKELNLGALLLIVSLVGAMKTVFISVNSVLALNYAVSYTAAVALTGVPLIVSAASGLLSQSLARIWGKRPVYLVSWGFVFDGAVWNTNVLGSYAQCMAARVFQGMGWGAFDVLVLGSIYDTYYVSVFEELHRPRGRSRPSAD